MLGREENWFQRNRGFILGFAIAVVVLNIVFAVLLPSEKSAFFEGTPMEYAVEDEVFETARSVRLDGTLTSRAFRPTELSGTLEIDGAAWKLSGVHENGAWEIKAEAQSSAEAESGFRLKAVCGDRELNTVVLLAETAEGETHFISLHAASRTAALRNYQDYFMVNIDK